MVLSDGADNLHEGFLTLDQILDMVDGEGAVRELDAAEEGFEIRTVKNADVCEGTLISICSAIVRAGVIIPIASPSPIAVLFIRFLLVSQ